MKKTTKKTTNRATRMLAMTVVLGLCLAGCGSQQAQEQQSAEPMVAQDAQVGVVNPWTDCGTDLNQAAQLTGFSFAPEAPGTLTAVRVMGDLMELVYQGERGEVTLRKALTAPEEYNGDISGVYGEYEDVETALDNGTPVHLRMDGDTVMAAYFAAENGYFSCSGENGMTEEEARAYLTSIVDYEVAQLAGK